MPPPLRALATVNLVHYWRCSRAHDQCHVGLPATVGLQTYVGVPHTG